LGGKRSDRGQTGAMYKRDIMAGVGGMRIVVVRRGTVLTESQIELPKKGSLQIGPPEGGRACEGGRGGNSRSGARASEEKKLEKEELERKRDGRRCRTKTKKKKHMNFNQGGKLSKFDNKGPGCLDQQKGVNRGK